MVYRICEEYWFRTSPPASLQDRHTITPSSKELHWLPVNQLLFVRDHLNPLGGDPHPAFVIHLRNVMRYTLSTRIQYNTANTTEYKKTVKITWCKTAPGQRFFSYHIWEDLPEDLTYSI